MPKMPLGAQYYIGIVTFFSASGKKNFSNSGLSDFQLIINVVLLQLRTYAAAGMRKGLRRISTAIDLVALAALVSIGVLTATSTITDPLHVSYANDVDGSSYDPYLWFALTPLDFFTLLVNLYLVYDAHRDRRKEGIRMFKLMTIMLRDNICYLVP